VSPKNHFELVIKQSKHFEGLLKTHFGATGQGLHQLVSSIKTALPKDLVKDLRKIATIRNKLIHDQDYDSIDESAFNQACASADQKLQKLTNTASSGFSSNIIGIVIAVVILLIVIISIPPWVYLIGGIVLVLLVVKRFG